MVSGEEIRERIDRVHPLVRDPAQDPRAPSRDYVFADGVGGKIGFINSVSEPFCDSCNRIRITADGKLRTCLFSVVETDLRALLRGGAGDREIAEVIRARVWEKEPGHRIDQPDFAFASRSMSQIGG
jgi:cyclic pyranopterin phosphate synthase